MCARLEWATSSAPTTSTPTCCSVAIIGATLCLLGTSALLVFSPTERATGAWLPLQHGPDGVATDVRVKRSAPLQAMFRRTCELGVLVGGAQRTTHLFGRRIDHNYRANSKRCWTSAKPVTRYSVGITRRRSPSNTLAAIVRVIASCGAETCSNDTRHFGVGRRLDNLPSLREKEVATNDLTLALQADLLSSTVDTGQLAALAEPTLVGQRRIPGFEVARRPGDPLAGELAGG